MLGCCLVATHLAGASQLQSWAMEPSWRVGHTINPPMQAGLQSYAGMCLRFMSSDCTRPAVNSASCGLTASAADGAVRRADQTTAAWMNCTRSDSAVLPDRQHVAVAHRRVHEPLPAWLPSLLLKDLWGLAQTCPYYATIRARWQSPILGIAKSSAIPTERLHSAWLR